VHIYNIYMVLVASQGRTAATVIAAVVIVSVGGYVFGTMTADPQPFLAAPPQAGASIAGQELAKENIQLKGQLTAALKELAAAKAKVTAIAAPTPAPSAVASSVGGGSSSGSEGVNTRQVVQFPRETSPSVCIEIGLHNTVMQPLGPESHVIAVEASLATIHKNWNLLSKPWVMLVNAAIFDKDSLGIFQVGHTSCKPNTFVYRATPHALLESHCGRRCGKDGRPPTLW
jgi:hypothetical protein